MARLGTVGKYIGGGGKSWMNNTSIEGRYMKKEDQELQNLWNQFGIAGPQEQEMANAQMSAIRQAIADREATRTLILAQMGLKQVGNQLVPLTNEERRAMMSKAELSREEAKTAYQQRAMAAVKGETKLPSFLKKNIDLQKAKEEALLGEILGEDVVKSTAGQQAVAAMKKKEEDLRQRLQEEDLKSTPGMAAGLGGQQMAKRQGLISAYESLPSVNDNAIRARAGILNQLQDVRLSMLKEGLGKVENKRQMIQNFYTLGGQFGGAAAAYAQNRKKSPEPSETKVDYGFFNSGNSPEYKPYSTADNYYNYNPDENYVEAR